MSGKVYLVGAGPGDPELLTVKAARLLRRADAVLHDDLVPSEILKLISPAAMVNNVGKRCGRKSIRQEEINFLMITLASAGLQVVRLKSGDPFVFGRGGEEVEALRAAQVEYEIVPGITSALGAAAAAEIPLTDRRASSAVTFLTVHQATNKDQPDWNRLANSGATLVFYMPGNNYGEISSRLRRAGLPPQTPCAIISRATTPEQEVHRTTINKLNEAPALPAPSLLVVGEVVRFGNSPGILDAGFTGLDGLIASEASATNVVP
ncbi:MAG TPA: uroporphyrinogen-III C-methyltransferase [Terriglobales bacterium]